MDFKEFIKNHIRVAPEGKHIELTSAQEAFIDWLEEHKDENFVLLRSRSGQYNQILKALKEFKENELG